MSDTVLFLNLLKYMHAAQLVTHI